MAVASYQTPAMLFGNLDKLAQTKAFNFVWVGLVVTKNQMTPEEEELANKVLAEKNCYAVYYTEEQINPCLRFYESLVRSNMHNFVDSGDHLKMNMKDWTDFRASSHRLARRVHQIR